MSTFMRLLLYIQNCWTDRHHHLHGRFTHVEVQKLQALMNVNDIITRKFLTISQHNSCTITVHLQYRKQFSTNWEYKTRKAIRMKFSQFISTYNTL